MSENLTFQLQDDGLGFLTIDRQGSKVNTLSMGVIDELEKMLERLEKESKAKLLVIRSGKSTGFIAGADISEFLEVKNFEEAESIARRGQRVLDRLFHLPLLTIALVDGVCLGGGLELALACHYRIVVDNEKTSLGLPEVNLGLIPGWGGTQRLPRLVGLQQGLKMILTGKPVDARKAYKIGLADAILAPPFVEEGLDAFIKQVRAGKVKRKRKGGLTSWALEDNPVGRFVVYRNAEKSVLSKSKGHYPAPLIALDVVKNTYYGELQKGLREEAAGIAKLFLSPVSKQLISLFFRQQALKKEPGVPEGGVARPVTAAGVLGAGIMGGGIAWLFSKGDRKVLMKDIHWDAVAGGFQAAQDVYQQLIKIRKLKPSQARVKMHHIQGMVDYKGFKSADLVIEAVVENLEVKKKVFQELEGEIRDDCIVGSNTSSLTVEAMAEAFKRPERFLGIHFFNPVNRMPLVEVVPGSKTSADTVATSVKLLQELGKTPIVVKDGPGFLVNRILMPYLNEAGWLLQEGVDFEKSDRLLEKFGMPMGPYRLADEIGLDVAYKAAKSLETAYGERMAVPPVLGSLVEAGVVGKKGKAAFYDYKGKSSRASASTRERLEKNRSGVKSVPEQEIVSRLILSMVNEAVRCLDEGVVQSPGHLDMAMVMGTGFPPFRGGVLAYAESQGVDRIIEELKQLERKYGSRFAPYKGGDWPALS